MCKQRRIFAWIPSEVVILRFLPSVIGTEERLCDVPEAIRTLAEAHQLTKILTGWEASCDLTPMVVSCLG